jgi:hypothetical protein
VRRRKPLAALAAACVAAAIVLALTAFPAEPATAISYVPMKVTPSCGAPSSQTGYSVRLTASNLWPGTNTLYIGEQGPNHDTTTNLGTLTIPDDGTLDQTVTLPAQSGNVPYEVYVTSLRNRGAYGVFSVPCPTLNVQPTCGPADDGSGAHYALTVSGANYGPPPTVPGSTPPTYPLGGAFFPVHIELDGTEVPGSPAKVNADGTFSVLVTPSRAKPGTHTFHAYQTNADGNGRPAIVTFRDNTTTFTVPCPTTQTTPTTQSTPTQTTPTTAPTTASTPTKSTATTTKTTKTTTTTTQPTGPVTLSVAPTCLETSSTGTSRVQVSGSGFAPGSLEVLVDGNVATKAAADGDGGFSAEVDLTAGSADHAIEARQGSRRADATLRVPCASHPALRLKPALGAPGFVTTATGSGFPPNVLVRLSWVPGIGTWTVKTDASGAFELGVLVFPLDQTGTRVLRATPVSAGRFTKVDASFLCVPGSMQPRSFEVRR